MSSEEWLTPLHIRDVVSDANARPSPYRVRPPSLPPPPRVVRSESRRIRPRAPQRKLPSRPPSSVSPPHPPPSHRIAPPLPPPPPGARRAGLVLQVSRGRRRVRQVPAEALLAPVRSFRSRRGLLHVPRPRPRRRSPRAARPHLRRLSRRGRERPRARRRGRHHLAREFREAPRDALERARRVAHGGGAVPRRRRPQRPRAPRGAPPRGEPHRPRGSDELLGVQLRGGVHGRDVPRPDRRPRRVLHGGSRGRGSPSPRSRRRGGLLGRRPRGPRGVRRAQDHARDGRREPGGAVRAG